MKEWVYWLWIIITIILSIIIATTIIAIILVNFVPPEVLFYKC